MKNYYFIGIGGVSMFQLALFLKNLGNNVKGYDKSKNENVKVLKQSGIKVFNKKSKRHLKNIDVVIVTGAIKSGFKELKYAKKLGILILDRAELLGEICSKFKCVVAVSGTHGKSTTCNMIYHILQKAGMKVSCHIGGIVQNPRMDIQDDILVVEACEYNKSFLKIIPTIAVILNVEKEHLDCYKNFYNLKMAFIKFAKSSKEIVVAQDKSTNFITNKLHCKVVKLHGDFNLKNQEVAIAVCKSLGVKRELALEYMTDFVPVKRRQEFIGMLNGMQCFIDYAHHSSEVKAFVEWFGSNNLIIFQPHTFSRTKLLFKEYVFLFKNLKNIIIFKSYPARERKKAGYTAKRLFKEVREYNKNVKYCNTAVGLYKKILKYNDLKIAFVGAGNINLIAKKCMSLEKIFKNPLTKSLKSFIMKC